MKLAEPIVTARKISKAKHSGPRGSDGAQRLAQFVGAPNAYLDSFKLFEACQRHRANGLLRDRCPECAAALDSRGTCPTCGWAPEREPKKVLAHSAADSHSKACATQHKPGP